MSLVTADGKLGCFSSAVMFSFVNPAGRDILQQPFPELYFDSPSDPLNKNLLLRLGDYILPFKNLRCPLALDCLLDIQENHRADVRTRALNRGFLGARRILDFQMYKNPDFRCDGNAYTFTSTLTYSTLRIFACYLVDSLTVDSQSGHSGTPSAPLKFHLLLLGVWTLDASFAKIIEGITSFLNLMKWAEATRIRIVEDAAQILG